MTLVVIHEGSNYTFPNIWHRYISRAIMGSVEIAEGDIEKAKGRFNARGYGLKIAERSKFM